MLENLANYATIEEAVMFLLSFDNALTYNKEDLLSRYVDGVTEQEALGLCLCGTSNCELVYAFIAGHRLQQFLTNVSFNSVSSVPLILRAIQLRLAVK